MMNCLTRNVLRSSALKSISTSLKASTTIGKRAFTRNIWHMSKQPEVLSAVQNSKILVNKPSVGCSCGCGLHHMHTKAERELVEFLTEEIVAERKAQKTKTIPTEVDGFKVSLKGSEVELCKDDGKEKILISFNINHTVDTEDEPEVDESMDKPNIGEMKSRPTFEIDIVRGGKTLSFTCSFLTGPVAEGEYNDCFGIDEVTLYEGEWNEKNYAVAGDVLDGYLYDLLMNLLEEKGISNEFADKLSNLSTAYEHSAYIGLLESMSQFTIANPKEEMKMKIENPNC